ncbi:MAG: hypothetical protein LQ337_006470 [Flavoplaca oasis]|nr:MAG: hypothetical protein LQ337_006470 [Flavoplaca oasis]
MVEKPWVYIGHTFTTYKTKGPYLQKPNPNQTISSDTESDDDNSDEEESNTLIAEDVKDIETSIEAKNETIYKLKQQATAGNKQLRANRRKAVAVIIKLEEEKPTALILGKVLDALKLECESKKQRYRAIQPNYSC